MLIGLWDLYVHTPFAHFAPMQSAISYPVTFNCTWSVKVMPCLLVCTYARHNRSCCWNWAGVTFAEIWISSSRSLLWTNICHFNGYGPLMRLDRYKVHHSPIYCSCVRACVVNDSLVRPNIVATMCEKVLGPAHTNCTS